MVLKCIFSDNHLAFCQVKYLEVITCLPQVQRQGMATNKYCVQAPHHGLLFLRPPPDLASMTLMPVSAPTGVPGGPMMKVPGGGGAGGPGGRGVVGRGLGVV